MWPRLPAPVAALWAIALAAVAFALSFTLAAGRGGAAPQTRVSPYRGSVSPHVPLPDFSLRDQFGRPARLADFRGKPLWGSCSSMPLCDDLRLLIRGVPSRP